MELTAEQIKKFIYYGTFEGEDVCDLKIPEGEGKPHLDWALSIAFKKLDEQSVIDGKLAETFLFKRIENLVKFINVNKTSHL